VSSYGPKSPQQQEREAAQALVKKYGTPGSTEGVLGEPHTSRRHGYGPDLWTIEKRENGKLGEPKKTPFGSY